MKMKQEWIICQLVKFLVHHCPADQRYIILQQICSMSMRNKTVVHHMIHVYQASRITDTCVIPNTKFNVNAYSEQECLEMFHFKAEHMGTILDLLFIEQLQETMNRNKFQSFKGICIVLHHLAYPSHWRDLVAVYGRSESSLSQIFHHMVDIILNKVNAILYLDKNRLVPWLQEFLNAIESAGSPIQSIVGFIDGTVWPISCPTKYQRCVYNGHKRCHAIKFQYVVTPDGLVSHLWGPLEGQRHNITLLRMSRLKENLKDFEGFFIYGDPAYSNSNRFCCPFQPAVMDVQKEVNKRMSSAWETVEWGFGDVIKYFAFVDLKKQMKIQKTPVANMYKLAIFLQIW